MTMKKINLWQLIAVLSIVTISIGVQIRPVNAEPVTMTCVDLGTCSFDWSHPFESATLPFTELIGVGAFEMIFWGLIIAGIAMRSENIMLAAVIGIIVIAFLGASTDIVRDWYIRALVILAAGGSIAAYVIFRRAHSGY